MTNKLLEEEYNVELLKSSSFTFWLNNRAFEDTVFTSYMNVTSIFDKYIL